MISSDLNISAVVRNVIEISAEILSADAGSFAILQPDQALIAHRFHIQYGKTIDHNKKYVDPGCGIAWKLVTEGKPVLLSRYSHFSCPNEEWIKAGYKAFIGVPLYSGKKITGAIGLFSKNENREFDPGDLRLLETIARIAGSAIENAFLLEAEKRSRNNAEMLREATFSITSALELEEVLESVLKYLKNVVPYDSATIFLITEDGIHAVAGRGLPNPEQVIHQTFPKNDSLFKEAQEKKQAIILEEAKKDPRFQQWGTANYIAGWMGIPLIWHDEVIGLLTIDSLTLGAYDKSDAEIAQAYANQAAIVIQNSILFEKTQEMAIKDPLTSVHNRWFFFEVARNEFEKSIRYERPLSIMLFDIDDFKRINDIYGHQTGDQVLIDVSTSVKTAIRETDLICRFGGDEFIILLIETGQNEAHQIANRIQQKILKVALPDRAFEVSLSIGIAEKQSDQESLDDLIHKADMALYSAKARGKNKICF